jgi:predicted AlkP superfamily pyrophosphatase or phosphodiesterase
LVFSHIFQLWETWRVPLTLPRAPKDLGEIRHVFASALAGVAGKPNRLRLPKKDRVIVVVVDGLGSENLHQRAGHAPFLSQNFRKGRSILAAFPATTAVNIGSFATALMPGEHGLIGHQVWDRFEGERLNLLVGWNERTDPSKWQPHRLVSEEAFSMGIACNVIAAAEYQATGFTKATMRQTNFLGADSLEQRIDRAIEVANAKEHSISYLYFPELDKFGHQGGWTSSGWAAILEQIDAGLNRLSRRLGGSGLLITADHGMVETAPDKRLRLEDELDGLSVEFFGGDTRTSYLYFANPDDGARAKDRLAKFNSAFGAYSSQELIEAGWYGSIGAEASHRLPELVLLARHNYTLYHSRFSKQRSLDMISHHGSISDAELRVPLIRIGF